MPTPPTTPGAPPVVVVGAGLSGLCCALRLHEAGREVVVVERSDRVGGRVATDRKDGFLLDRGFQVLLTSYPEVQDRLDLDALGLRAFRSGSAVRLPDRTFLDGLAGIDNEVEDTSAQTLLTKMIGKLYLYKVLLFCLVYHLSCL